TNPDRTCEITAVEDPDALAAGIRLYPNPTQADGMLTIESLQAPLRQVRVFNNVGQLYRIVHRDQLGDEHLQQINLQHLPRGIYRVEVWTTLGASVLNLVVRK